MKRYVFIALFILCQLSLSTRLSDGLRSAMVASLAPSWSFFVWPSGRSPEMKKEIEMLRLENHHLHHQVELLKEEINLEKLQAEYNLYSQAVIGKVIFRETASWSSSFWINVGEKTSPIIAKNCPVVVGTSVVGIIEYVGGNRSRVRLITDGSVVPSVRLLRGGEQKLVLIQQIKRLMEMIAVCNEIPEAKQLKTVLQHLSHRLNTKEENHCLAKGELQGVREPIWRSRHTLLRGVGFNCDFEDEESPYRDLRSDKPLLVKEGDILVTTGMDGVFPAGLRVGQVAKVYPLQEGAISYELDAQSLIEDFENISFVTVLPSIPK